MLQCRWKFLISLVETEIIPIMAINDAGVEITPKYLAVSRTA